MNEETKKQIKNALLRLCQFYGVECYTHGKDGKRELPDPKNCIDEFFKEIASFNL